MRNPVVRFLVIALSLIVGWVLLYEFWISPAGALDSWVISKTTVPSMYLLHHLGFDAHIEGQNVFVPDMGGAFIGNECNGLPLFALFAGFVLAYPGPWKVKLWFIPAGILVVHVLNILRVVALILIQIKAPNYMEINHTYTFTILMYGFIFIMWMWWVRRSSPSRPSAE
jgi:exosortase/archaeosortase family protein